MKLLFFFIINCFTILIFNKSCNNDTTKKQIAVNPSLFIKHTENLNIETVECTLSNGTKTQCLKITTKSIPTDHETGPWCPEKITDSDENGGIWFKDGKLYDVDGEFIKNLAQLYDDDKWQLYDENGNVFKTKTEEDCIQLKGAKLVDKFTNYCIECLPEYTKNITRTVTIPLNPIKLEKPISLAKKGQPNAPRNGEPRPPRPDHDHDHNLEHNPNHRPRVPNTRGIAFNGVIFDGPAPLHIILSGYTIPALDDAGGHVNLDHGYHYHATTGKTKKITQSDGHAPMIGYAMDGFGLFNLTNEDGSLPKDLDECRGHYDEIRGYHYHVDKAGNNNFINCFSGAIVN